MSCFRSVSEATLELMMSLSKCRPIPATAVLLVCCALSASPLAATVSMGAGPVDAMAGQSSSDRDALIQARKMVWRSQTSKAPTQSSKNGSRDRQVSAVHGEELGSGDKVRRVSVNQPVSDPVYVESVESPRVTRALPQYQYDPVIVDGACDSMVSAPSMPCLTLRAEYLLWSLDGVDTPALATTSPAGTAPESAGLLTLPTTTILFGGDSEGESYHSGGRLTLDWATGCHGDGFELGAMGIFEDSETFTDSRSILARPVFDTSSGTESAMLVAHPDFLTGTLSIDISNELWALDAICRRRISRSRCDQLDLLFGYRHASFEETLLIDQSSLYTASQGQIIAGTTVSLFDDFQAENQFNGGQVGLRYLRRYGPCTYITTVAKLGVGVTQGEARIDGGTTNTVPNGGSASFVGGLLAQSTNIGMYKDSEFSALPELGITLTHRFAPALELGLGYNLIVWSNVVRVSDQIDRRVSQFPPVPPSGTQNPAYQFETDTFIAHGLNFGATFAY